MLSNIILMQDLKYSEWDIKYKNGMQAGVGMIEFSFIS